MAPHSASRLRAFSIHRRIQPRPLVSRSSGPNSTCDGYACLLALDRFRGRHVNSRKPVQIDSSRFARSAFFRLSSLRRNIAGRLSVVDVSLPEKNTLCIPESHEHARGKTRPRSHRAREEVARSQHTIPEIHPRLAVHRMSTAPPVQTTPTETNSRATLHPK